MRYVLGVMVAVAMVVGCSENGAPTPAAPTCEGSMFPACIEGMVAVCDPALTRATLVDHERCLGWVVIDDNGDSTRCVEGVPSCDSGSVPECVEIPSTAADLCVAWSTRCAAMEAERCYVPVGTDDVIPY